MLRTISRVGTELKSRYNFFDVFYNIVIIIGINAPRRFVYSLLLLLFVFVLKNTANSIARRYYLQ